MNNEEIHRKLIKLGYDYNPNSGYVKISTYEVKIITDKAIDRYVKYGYNEINRIIELG